MTDLDLTIKPTQVEAETYGDGESWTKWYMFEPPLTQEETETVLEELNINSHYGRPGSPFITKAYLHTKNSEKTVIMQSGGWDI